MKSNKRRGKRMEKHECEGEDSPEDGKDVKVWDVKNCNKLYKECESKGMENTKRKCKVKERHNE